MMMYQMKKLNNISFPPQTGSRYLLTCICFWRRKE